MDTAVELAALKQEVAQLKQQLTEIRRFFNICESETVPGTKTLTLECSGIFLRNPDDPNKLQGMLTASNEGPVLALWGSDEKARVIIDVREDVGGLHIYQKDLKTGVDLGISQNGEPYVAVLHEGQPRAGLKALPDSGVISAVHDDGLVRVALISHATHAEMFVVGGDMKPAVKLSSDGQDGGGFLTVNHANGKAAVILSSIPVGGCVILNDSRGKIIASLPATSRETGGQE